MSQFGKLEGVKLQQKFVEKRKKTLGKAVNLDNDRLEEIVNSDYKKLIGRDCPDWADVYTKISDNLRKSDLTINLNAESWFSDANTYKAYAQMYERGVEHLPSRFGAARGVQSAQYRRAWRAQRTAPNEQSPRGLDYCLAHQFLTDPIPSQKGSLAKIKVLFVLCHAATKN